MVPAGSRRVPRAPRYSGFRYAPGGFAHGAITRCGRAFQPVTLASQAATARPYNPAGASPRQRFGLVPVRSPLLGESLLFSLPPGTKMFQFPGFAPRHKGAVPPHTGGGLPHSDTCGSMAGCASPQLFAASRVLRRLLEPRHARRGVAYWTSRVLSFCCSLVCQCVKDRIAMEANVENNGFEPLTLCLQSRCSSQLS